METVARQLATSHHMRLPVFRDHEGDVVGVLHLRKVLGALHAGTLDEQALLESLDEPYFVPADHPGARAAAVLPGEPGAHRAGGRRVRRADGAGHARGHHRGDHRQVHHLAAARRAARCRWDEDGTATADGAMPVREVNRALGLSLPTDGPKTLNGLILEHLQDIPEADVSIKIAGVPMEIVHAQGRTVKTVRIFRPGRDRSKVHEASESLGADTSAFTKALRVKAHRPQRDRESRHGNGGSSGKAGPRNSLPWEGKDKAGKTVRGEMRAGGEAIVNATLRRQGILVIKVKKQKLGGGGKVTDKDITLFTRQLATMMKAGVPLLQAFDIVGKGASQPGGGAGC